MSAIFEIVTSETLLNKIIFSISYGRKNIYYFIMLALSTVSVGYLLLIGPIIFLDDNQILYIYSTSAQVVAGLYGLTLTGFIFFESKLKDIVLEDVTYYDHIESLKKVYYRDITTIGLITILSILMCFFSISLYKVDSYKQLPINLLLTLTMAFTITAIISIVQFSIKLLDPNKLSQIGKKIKSSIEKNKSNKIDKTENIETTNSMLLEFMKNYNELELTIINFAQELDELKITYEIKDQKTKPKIRDAFKILIYNQVINSIDMENIDMLRKYRNVVVHGKDFNIDESILNILKTYNEAMKNIFDARKREDVIAEDKAYKNLREKVDKLVSK